MRGRKTLVALALTGAALVAGTGNAFALDCTNASRPAPAEPAQPAAVVPGGPTIWVIQGNWVYISFDGPFADASWTFVPPGALVNYLGMPPDAVASLGLPASAVNGNYQAGTGGALLDKAQAPCLDSRQTSHGIQAECEK